jgi:hypothetical protein
VAPLNAAWRTSNGKRGAKLLLILLLLFFKNVAKKQTAILLFGGCPNRLYGTTWIALIYRIPFLNSCPNIPIVRTNQCLLSGV